MGDDAGVEDDVEMSGWMRWSTAAEDGRDRPHPGGRYVATAFPATVTADVLWSIEFDDVPAGPGIGLGEGAAQARWLSAGDVSFEWEAGTRLVIAEGPRAVADFEILATASRAARPWTLRVVESFNITGRGVGVFGDLTGVIAHNGLPAELQSRDRLMVVPEVWLEFARIPGGERIALMLRGVEKEQVVPGSLLRGHAPWPGQ